ncbi:SGNH/GDSL hydrolase family protein [Spiroplasma endosymbiont of Zeiraphera isertana]|uniref:SGNH/GDSL hydrolase family protein n=1 Tax=Spiroplasma endosymbiont of Zeiraphera isertana TaxID=3066313 RepID=UPI00313ADD71
MNNNEKIKGNFYVLGDSLSDTGALVSGFTALFKHLKIPKIVKMLPPFYKNSFSNGPVAAQIIADYLHINLTSAWRFDLFLFADEQIGNNYAVSGALASRKKELTVENFVINHFDITHQVDALISQHHINSNDIILVEFVGNDILYAFKQSLLKDQEEIINKAVELIKNALTKLINKGAQHILLCNVPNMSIIPLFKNGLLPTCTCGGNNEIEWVQQYISNRKRLFEIYSKFEGKQMYEVFLNKFEYFWFKKNKMFEMSSNI